jgi:hypothetical protein
MAIGAFGVIVDLTGGQRHRSKAASLTIAFGAQQSSAGRATLLPAASSAGRGPQREADDLPSNILDIRLREPRSEVVLPTLG